MSEHAPDAAHGGEHHHQHDDMHYVKIWGILLVLLIVSFFGPWLGIKIVTLVTAFGIAFVKAWLVIKYFMHLDVEKRIVHYFLITSIVFMLLMFAGVAPDVMKHEGQNWENVAAKAEVQRALAEQAAGGGGHGHDAGGHDDKPHDDKPHDGGH